MLPGDVDTSDELARFIEEEQHNALMLNQAPQSPEPGVDIPIANVIRTPHTPFSTAYTPLSSVRRRQPSDLAAGTVSAKKSLSQSFTVAEDGDVANAFSDIRALLGH
jgi:hypothetical protein